MVSATLVPLLPIQRELYDIPRGMERFQRYLAVLTSGTDDVNFPPLVTFNPMGKDRASETVDALIAFDAEAVAAEAVAEAGRRLAGARVSAEFRVGLVVADDSGGGWTNRGFTELAERFPTKPGRERGWISALSWTSEVPTPDAVRQGVLAALYRTAYRLRHGLPRTLRELMTQEGLAAVFSRASGPTLDPDDLSYSRAVIEPHLDASDLPTVFPCLYGDRAARAVGYTPFGLSPRAGYAVALSEALARGLAPEGAV